MAAQLASEDHRQEIAEAIAREWFSGEVLDCPDGSQPLSLTSAATSPIEIRLSVATTRLVWRRNLDHIASEHSPIHILWMVLEGTMKITGPNGVHNISPGSMAVMTHDMPFIVQSENTPESPLIALTISVPEPFIDAQTIETSHLGVAYSCASAEGQMARTLFKGLLEVGNGLSRDMALKLAATAVQCVCNTIRAQEAKIVSGSQASATFDDVLAFIAANISDPELSGEAIATRCGTSRRQLHYLLKRSGTSLGELVWKQRLRNVAQWLSDGEMAGIPIAELAFAAGHKNYEHFCRAFKAMFGLSPRDYRTSQANGPPILHSESGKPGALGHSLPTALS